MCNKLCLNIVNIMYSIANTYKHIPVLISSEAIFKSSFYRQLMREKLGGLAPPVSLRRPISVLAAWTRQALGLTAHSVLGHIENSQLLSD